MPLLVVCTLKHFFTIFRKLRNMPLSTYTLMYGSRIFLYLCTLMHLFTILSLENPRNMPLSTYSLIICLECSSIYLYSNSLVYNVILRKSAKYVSIKMYSEVNRVWNSPLSNICTLIHFLQYYPSKIRENMPLLTYTLI